MRRLVLIVPVLLALSAGGAAADRGVALDLGRLDVTQALTPGGGYELPPLGVRNPGDERTSYRIVVSYVEGLAGRPIPPAWITLEPRRLTLAPGAARKVHAQLDLPSGADPGDYEGLLAAQIVNEGSGAQVGAGAAAKVTFTVESSTLLGAWWHELTTFASAHAPWTWLAPALLGLALAGGLLRRRFSFTVERRA